MTNTNQTASIIADLISISDMIDADDDPPRSTRDRIILALDMLIDDAHDYSTDHDDDSYPYAMTPAELIALRDMIPDMLT